MSGPLSSFSIRVGKPLQPTAAAFDSPSAFFRDASEAAETNFLAAQSDVPESFLNLEETSRPSGDSTNTEVVNGEEVILSGSNGVLGDEAPLLCLDQSTGLHVLVHSLCQTLQQPPVPQHTQDGDVTPEQFVVVWALQPEEEPMVVEKSLGCSENKAPALDVPRSVDTILGSPVMALGNERDDPAVQQILSSSIGTTLGLGIEIPPSQSYKHSQDTSKESGASPLIDIQGSVSVSVEDELQHKDASFIECPDAPMLTLQVADEGNAISSGTELQRDILMETVPHINLEEITEKFARESNQPLMDEKTDIPISERNDDYPLTVERESISLQDDLSTQRSFTSLPDENLRAGSRSNVTVKLKTSAVSNIIEESLDEESFYDILMTYKCKLCSEVFFDKARLLKHYEEVHKSRKGVKIYVTSESSSSFATLRPDYSSSGRKETVSTLYSDASVQKPRDLNLMTCRHCFRTFLGVQKMQQHVAREHPVESTKNTRKSKHKVNISLPTQPGLLFGHRESRLPTQANTDNVDKEETQKPEVIKEDNQKRVIRAPKNLNDQYWIHKQKPKPVLVSDKKRLIKCSIDRCRFRFSSKENVKKHEECHGQPGTKEEKLYFCNKCPEKFLKWGVCQIHLWKVHSIDVDLFTCGICQTYKTNAEHQLIIHQKIHSDVREYICKVCGKGFRQHAQLLNHEVLHKCNTDSVPQWHKKGFCTKCEKWFVDKQTLKRHMNSVHLKVKRHSCPHCPYKCTRKYDLSIHMRKHTGEKPHQCEFCGHHYRETSTIRRHKWIHFLTKAFKCPYKSCQYESSRIPHFKKHMTKKHPKERVIFKCQTCLLEIADLQKYMRHISVHEDHLFKEALDRRATSSGLSTNWPPLNQLNGVAVTLPPSSLSIPDVDIVNIKIEAIDDGVTNEQVNVEHSKTRSTLADVRQKSFVFEADVVSDGIQASQTAGNHCEDQHMAVKLPSAIGVSMSDMNISVEAMEDGDHVNEMNMDKGETENDFTGISPDAFVFEPVDSVRNVSIHNSQVCTISVDNLESLDNLLKRAESTCNLVRCESDIPKAAEPQQMRFGEMLEATLLEAEHQESSVLNVVHSNDAEPSMLESTNHGTTVLNVVEGNERTQVIRGEEENPTLMTLSQVMSDDGHQYIIGISPEEIAASQANIFDGH